MAVTKRTLVNQLRQVLQASDRYAKEIYVEITPLGVAIKFPKGRPWGGFGTVERTLLDAIDELGQAAGYEMKYVDEKTSHFVEMAS